MLEEEEEHEHMKGKYQIDENGFYKNLHEIQ